jgi:SAM-dependent methyltransferase
MRIIRGTLRYCWRLLPEPVRDRVRALPPLVALRNRLLRRKWEGASHDEVYDEEYFRFVEKSTQASVGALADAIMRDLRPETVLDVGCGTGALLAALRERGVRVKGAECAEAALRFCRARNLDVAKLDLTAETLGEAEPVDVVVSMEVGHQLPPEAADRYVDLLCRAGDAVVFSSETPGGGDRLPLNEQPHRYWVEKFALRRFAFNAALSGQWRAEWKARGAAPWFCRNVMVFYRHPLTVRQPPRCPDGS